MPDAAPPTPVPAPLNAAVDAAPPLPPVSQRGLMAMGLLQGIALYALLEWAEGKHGAEAHSWLALGMLLVVQVPLFMGMAVTRWRQPAPWLGGAVMALVVVVLGGATLWRNMHGAEGYHGALLRLGAALSLWWYVALAWFQAYLEQGNWRIAYRRLFVHAWHNALVLVVAAVCVKLIWLVLWLCAGLFALLGVNALWELFVQPWFALPFSGFAAGLGLWLARTLERPIQMMRQLILALGHLVLPLMGLVVLVFVLALLFTGVQTLWATRFAAVLLMGVVLFYIWLLNAVYQDGSAQRSPYPRAVQQLLHASLLALLVLATLACVAVGLRVAQYGWTADRVWAAAGSGLLWLYTAGYAAAALRSWRAGAQAQQPWLDWLSPVNRALSLVLLALLLALQTPVLDPERLSARSQLAQLLSGAQAITPERLMDLKFEHGMYGAAALQTLSASPQARTEEEQGWIRAIADSATRSDVPREHGSVKNPDEEWVDVPMAQQRIQQVAGDRPADDWWHWLLQRAESEHWATSCLFKSAECVLLSHDWDQDGQMDHLLCDVEETRMLRCRLSTREPVAGSETGEWTDIGQVTWPYEQSDEEGSARREALRSGRIKAQQPRWPEWAITLEGDVHSSPSQTGQLRAP